MPSLFCAVFTVGCVVEPVLKATYNSTGLEFIDRQSENFTSSQTFVIQKDGETGTGNQE